MQQELLFALPDPGTQDAQTIADEAVATILAELQIELQKYPVLMRKHADDWACTHVQFSALQATHKAMDRAASRGDAVATREAARAYCEAWRIVLKAAGAAAKRGET